MEATSTKYTHEFRRLSRILFDGAPPMSAVAIKSRCFLGSSFSFQMRAIELVPELTWYRLISFCWSRLLDQGRRIHLFLMSSIVSTSLVKDLGDVPSFL